MERMNRGFTLIELLVSVAIFAFMTALLVAKYGTFNQSVLLTNLGYDVAISIRTAQTYGVSVVSPESATNPNPSFKYAYGVDFTTVANPSLSTDPQQILLFSSTSNPDSLYYKAGGVDTPLNVYSIKRGAVIYDLCTGHDSTSCAHVDQLDVSFKRPDPSAIICSTVISGGSSVCGGASNTYAKITIRGTDGSTRFVTVLSNGQVTVEN